MQPLSKEYDTLLLPAFSDNYIFAITSKEKNQTIVVDPGEAPTVIRFLEQHNLELAAILVTHHHSDHMGGVEVLKNKFRCPVFGPKQETTRIPSIDQPLVDSQQFSIMNLIFNAHHTPGHTTGHFIYECQALNSLFVGDVLFGMGCGRVFEGTMSEAFESLQCIKKLSRPHTKIYCAHEYTRDNAKFADTLPNKPHKMHDRIIQINQLDPTIRTVPLNFQTELETNPFLLAKNVTEFSEVRNQRNHFKAILS